MTAYGETLLTLLTGFWAWVQYGVIAVALALGYGLSLVIEPVVEKRVRRIHHRPWLLRPIAAALRRTRWIIAALLLWAAFWVLQVTTWPSRSYLLGIATHLLTAWVAIAIASRLIRNRTLARAVALIAWTVVALDIVGLRGTVAATLESYALTLGDLRLSALVVIKGLGLLAALLWIASFVGNLIERSLRDNPDVTPSFQVLIGKLVKIALVSVAIVVAISAVGVDLTALTVLSGAIGLGLGFGLQKIVSNLVAGIIILSDKSIKPGDVIELGETFGWIRSLRARFVSLVTRDGREFLIPNEDFITQRVINWSFTDELVRLDVKFGVAYDSDPHVVRRLAVEAAAGTPRVAPDPRPVCHLEAFGDSSLDFVLRFWISDPAAGLTNVRGAVLLACWDVFKANGVAIPYPHRDVLIRRSHKG